MVLSLGQNKIWKGNYTKERSKKYTFFVCKHKIIYFVANKCKYKFLFSCDERFLNSLEACIYLKDTFILFYG